MGSVSEPGALQILQAAIKKVPAVRYALGVAGVAGAAAMGVGFFQQKPEIAVFGTAIMLAFMVVLLVFATLSRMTNSPAIQYAALVMLWVTMLCFSAAVVLLTSSYFFHTPIDFRKPPEVPSADCQRLRATQHRIYDFISDQCILATRLSDFAAVGTNDAWNRVREKAESFRKSEQGSEEELQKQPDLFRRPAHVLLCELSSIDGQKGGYSFRRTVYSTRHLPQISIGSI